MLDFDVLRGRIAMRLNQLRGKHGQNLATLFGEGRPCGRYDGDLFDYFTGMSDVHPILPLAYLRTAQNAAVADAVLGIMLEELAAELNGLSRVARTRVRHWQAAQAGSKLVLQVTDEVAFGIMRPALDYMLAHYDHADPRRRSDYRTGVLVGQLVAWFLGDMLMDELPTETFPIDARMSMEIRKEYEQFVARIIRTAYATRQLPLHERMATCNA